VYVELSADVAVPVGVLLPVYVELLVDVAVPVYVALPVAEVVMVAFGALVALQEA
jgi:hypothetical protein